MTVAQLVGLDSQVRKLGFDTLAVMSNLRQVCSMLL